MPKILDACCGSRMFWFDKHNPYTTYMDIRKEYEKLPTGHVIDVNPDIIGDFRDMPFDDNEFDLVVFDPPHLKRAAVIIYVLEKKEHVGIWFLRQKVFHTLKKSWLN